MTSSPASRREALLDAETLGALLIVAGLATPEQVAKSLKRIRERRSIATTGAE